MTSSRDYYKASEFKSEQNLDPNKLNEVIGDAIAVGLGELTHGASEIFNFKSEVFKYLVKCKDFKLLLFEASQVHMVLLEEFIQGNRNSLPPSNSIETNELMVWLKKYNAEHKPEDKVHVAGIDDNYYRIDLYKSLLEKISHKEFYDLFIKVEHEISAAFSIHREEHDFNNYKNSIAKVHSTYPDLEKNLENLKEIFKQNQGDYEKQITSSEFKQLKLLMQSLENFYKYTQGYHLKQREIGMSENADRIWKEHQKVNFGIWGHNGHVMKIDYPWNAKQSEESRVVWLGQLLAKKYGEKYRTIGAIAYEGNFQGYTQDNKYGDQAKLFPADPKSLESEIHNSGISKAFMNLRDIDCPSQLERPILCRTGVGTHEMENKNCFGDFDLKNAFDGVVYFDKVTAAKFPPPTISNSNTTPDELPKQTPSKR